MAKHPRTTHAMLVSETARRLGVTEQTVRDWADSGITGLTVNTSAPAVLELMADLAKLPAPA